jgi:hypothetical protein
MRPGSATTCGGRAARAGLARVSRGWRAVGLGVLAALCGCAAPSSGLRASAGDEKLPPVLERLRKAYPDLQSGPFLALATFESPRELELFRVESRAGDPAGRAQPALNLLRARDQTGAGSLSARLAQPGDRLALNARFSKSLAIPADWRPYALMLASYYAPPNGQALEFAIESGGDRPARWQRTLRLAPGWNLVRQDLAEVGDAIDLANVRAVTWSAVDADTADLILDDLVLADNTADLLKRGDAPDALYAFRQGRRTHVGAAARFELAFSGGALSFWSDASGPNLTLRTGLGPWPTPLPEQWDATAFPPAYDDPAYYADWGAIVEATTDVAELSAFRAVVVGEWRFGPVEARPAPRHTWRYTIYPDGRVFVRATSDPAGARWAAPHVGYALVVDGHRGFARHMPLRAASEAAPTWALLARSADGRADLLCAPSRRELAMRQVFAVTRDDQRAALLLGHAPGEGAVDASFMLRVWPPDIDGAPEAESHAADYQFPAELTLQSGRLVRDAPGDLDGDGFNESEGLYELEAVQRRVRFVFDPEGRVRHAPLFRLRGIPGGRAWVYVEGRVREAGDRDADGSLLFALGRAVSTPIRVEVYGQP